MTNKILSVIVFALILVSMPILAKDNPSGIVVFGQAQKSVPADEWQLQFNIELKEKNKDLLTSKYNKTKAQLEKELKKIGINQKEVETQNFSMYPWYQWENNTNVRKGQQLNQHFSIKKDNLEIIEKIVTTISSIESISISNIGHDLKFETRQSETKKLYQEAFKSARAKIDAILAASGQKFNGYLLISEDLNDNYSTQMEMVGARAGAVRDSKQQIEVSLVPMNITIQTKLKIVANIKD